MRLSDFDDTKYGGGEKGNFFNLVQGDNKLRIVSEFAAKYSHFANNKYLGPCTQDEDCVFCNQENKPSVKFLCHVIDRKDGTIKLAQFGVVILKQLKQYSLDPQYKFTVVPNWDCNIIKTGERLETKYAVIPDRNDLALTNEEKEMIEKLKSPLDIVMAMNKKQTTFEASLTDKQTSTQPEVNVDDIPFN